MIDTAAVFSRCRPSDDCATSAQRSAAPPRADPHSEGGPYLRLEVRSRPTGTDKSPYRPQVEVSECGFALFWTTRPTGSPPDRRFNLASGHHGRFMLRLAMERWLRARSYPSRDWPCILPEILFVSA